MSGNTNNAVLTPTIKVCVRRLPANMNSESFLSVCKTQCASHVWEGQGTLLYYVNGRTKGRKTTFSRAYVGFRGLREAEQFAVEWGKIAKLWAEESETDKKSALAVVAPCVEPAPFQRMPRAVERVDPEQGKLDDYPLFVEFVAESKKERVAGPSVDVMLERRLAASLAKKDEVIISPLLREVMDKKLRELEREKAKIRQKTILTKPGQPGAQPTTTKRRTRGGRNKSGTNNAGQLSGKKKGPRRQDKRNRGKKKADGEGA